VLRFVIQKHAASRLHYDFRLETPTGLLKSWAVPKGVSLDPAERRLAIMTEDHPGDYADFEGVIPEGNYGAGRVIVWDNGTYLTDKDINEQVRDGKVTFSLNGKKVKGGFSLVRLTKNEKQWLLIKSRDEYASTLEINREKPESVQSGRIVESMPDPRTNQTMTRGEIGVAQEFPTSVKPMLAMPVDKPFDNDDWVFEVKWDGVRALLFRDKSADFLQIRSRKGGEITQRYPELVKLVDSDVKCNNSVILDGEIVVLNDKGLPDFQLHQRRMNVDNRKEVSFLSRASPATYYVFDILYLDGLSLESLDLLQRREILSRIVKENASRIRISDYIEREGTALFENVVNLKLEGIVAKYKHSKYLQGSRSGAWLKIKGSMTQDCAVIGYTRGEGNREGYPCRHTRRKVSICRSFRERLCV
jgi:bifunctional non-homologous end joining protein LigD